MQSVSPTVKLMLNLWLQQLVGIAPRFCASSRKRRMSMSVRVSRGAPGLRCTWLLPMAPWMWLERCWMPALIRHPGWSGFER